MASGGYGPVIRQVERLLEGGGTAVALGEGQLLRRFAMHRDEAAFEALVGRHGPMVLGTCRRMLANPHDVEDAFQATFLVLARRAGSIRDGDRLGPWLHGVARRVATRSRALTARRNARERPGDAEPAVFEPDISEALDLRSALDEELARLPEKYRAPLVLCYLEGLTHDEAARQLSWPVGTVRSRLAGGRDRLRARLTRRGLSPSAAVPAALPVSAMPEALLSSTVRIATLAGSAPAHVASLAKGALVAMMWSKLKAFAALGLVAGLTVGGASALPIGGDGLADGPRTEARPAVDPGDQAKRPPEDDLARLQGRWRLVKQQPELRDPGDRAVEVEWTINGDTLASTLDGKSIAARKIRPIPGSVDGAKALDIASDQNGKMTILRCLYRLAGGTLETCAGNLEDGPRPTEFRADGTVQRLYTFERITDPSRPVDGPLPAGADIQEARRRVVDLTERLARAESEIQILRRERADLVTQTIKAAKAPGAPKPAPDAKAEPPLLTPAPPPAPAAAPTARAADPSAPPDGGTRPAQPWVMNFPNGPNVLVISADRDKATIVNTETNSRWTYRLPRGLTEAIPVIGPGLSPSSGTTMGAFALKGQEITQIVAFDTLSGNWYPQDLREPARGSARPVVGIDLVTYQVGRFLYVFSAPARKWGVLELKDSPRAGSFALTATAQGGKMVVPDGGVLHFFDTKTGQWTQIDTKDEP